MRNQPLVTCRSFSVLHCTNHSCIRCTGYRYVHNSHQTRCNDQTLNDTNSYSYQPYYRPSCNDVHAGYGDAREARTCKPSSGPSPCVDDGDVCGAVDTLYRDEVGVPVWDASSSHGVVLLSRTHPSLYPHQLPHLWMLQCCVQEDVVLDVEVSEG